MSSTDKDVSYGEMQMEGVRNAGLSPIIWKNDWSG